MMTVAAPLASLLAGPLGGLAAAQHRTTDVATSIRPSDPVLSRPVTIALDNVSLSNAVDRLATSAGVRVFYRTTLLEAVRAPITLHADRLPLGIAFERILTGTRLEAIVSEGTVITIREVMEVQQAQGIVQGKVVNTKTKQTIANATVTVDENTKGVSTANDGTFRLTLSAGSHTIHARSLGFARQTQRVTVADGQATQIDIALEPSTSVLDEVVVTGTVVATERKAIATPITVISAADIEKRGITRIDQLFRGEVPGVVALDVGITNAYTNIGGMVESRVYSRGTVDNGGTPNPLKTYVDGIEIVDAKYLGTIDPKTIERIEIISGPQASTIYGAGAMGGVMQIFTKKGVLGGSTMTTLSFKYGTLENNQSSGRTPQHNHALNVNGGASPLWSYSANLSYGYTGQWQPGLYVRSIGGSVGAVHDRGSFSISGSMNGSYNQNGVMPEISNGLIAQKMQMNGTYRVFGIAGTLAQRVSLAASQTQGVTIDFRNIPWLHQSLTVGRSENDFKMRPLQPAFIRTDDTLMRFMGSNARRVSGSYNVGLNKLAMGPVSSVLTMGITGSSGSGTSTYGLKDSPKTQLLSNSSVSQSWDQSWGIFGSWNLGLFDRLYMPFGIRFEQNPAYGNRHKVDITPTNGIAYTIEYRDMTLKLQGSYGAATLTPDRFYKDAQVQNAPAFDPSVYYNQYANPDLRPEYTKGPQGGFELYYGNRGSLQVNYYAQTVKDKLISVQVDSVRVTVVEAGFDLTMPINRWVNYGTLNKHGADGRATLNLGPFQLAGTYSLVRTRMGRYAPGESYPDWVFRNEPSHAGNFSVTYARGGTTALLGVNWIGQTYIDGSRTRPGQLCNFWQNARLDMYVDIKGCRLSSGINPGYTKANFNASHRITRVVTATFDVANIADSYTSDGGWYSPTLGRVTTLGVSIRRP